MHVLVSFMLVSVINTMTKGNLGGKLVLASRLQSNTEGI